MEKTTRGAGIACSGYANCYVGCSCNTSNGWYSSCQGTDCKSVTDTRYTGVNAMSASNVSDVTSLTDGKSAQSTSGNTQVVSLSGGVSTMGSSGATTCYKKKTCEEGGYYSSVPADQKCSSKSYNGYTCYYSCSYKTCSDYGYKSSIPSGQTCTATYPRSGLTCYKDCKNNTYDPVTVTVTATLSKPGYDVQGIKYSFTLTGDKMYFSGEITCDDVSGSLNNCLGGSIDVPPGDYTVSVMMNSARIRKTGTLPWGQWSFIDATCSSKNISISGSSPTYGTYVTCSSGSINDR